MEATLTKLAKEMGDAGYCNYGACVDYLVKAYEAGRLAQREQDAKLVRAQIDIVLAGASVTVLSYEEVLQVAERAILEAR